MGCSSSSQKAAAPANPDQSTPTAPEKPDGENQLAVAPTTIIVKGVVVDAVNPSGNNVAGNDEDNPALGEGNLVCGQGLETSDAVKNDGKNAVKNAVKSLKNAVNSDGKNADKDAGKDVGDNTNADNSEDNLGYEKHLGKFRAFTLSEHRVQHGGHDVSVTWLNPRVFWACFGGPNQQVWVYLDTHKDYVQTKLPHDRHASNKQSVLDTIASAGLQEQKPASAQQANPFVFYNKAGECWIFMARDRKYTHIPSGHQAERIAVGHIG